MNKSIEVIRILNFFQLCVKITKNIALLVKLYYNSEFIIFHEVFSLKNICFKKE